MDKELLKTISRLRRAMPRNEDVMALCDALEARLLKSDEPTIKADDEAAPINRPKFDKTAYQREYMRKRRAERPS
jgi:hypothetical protein